MEILNSKKYEVVVVGAGHSGVEAALASARLGKKTLLITLNLDSIAFMACNPNIGGTAKGHLVREIDALGGQIGINADKSLIQLRMLNDGKGAAVQSLRGQADKLAYHSNMKFTLEKQKDLDIIQTEVEQLLVENGVICGVTTVQNINYYCRSVVLATGVYLKGRIIQGEFTKESGPNGFAAATFLTKSLQDNGVQIVRFKTGTPARVNKNSINFEGLDIQNGDEIVYSFSTMTTEKIVNKLPCYLTYTNEKTHEIIMQNLSRAPMYNGSIHGIGPRYCPSIEDKVVRFKDKNRHQVFLEPEGMNTDEYYIQGVSTSLPIDVQEQMYRSIKGLECAQITRYAYAIEYDCIDPTQLTPYLMIKSLPGLFTAGQINGSSGYEEAAAQGLVAGINAVRYINGETPFVLRRDEAYIGVLIDDLVTKGTNEPYRMMTARAEHRLYLRQDNADIRLTQRGREIGLVDDERYAQFSKKLKDIEQIYEKLNRISPPKEYTQLFNECSESISGNGILLKDILRRNNITASVFRQYFTDFLAFDIECLMIVETEIKYEGYLKKQLAAIKECKRLENTEIPTDADYTAMDGLRTEAKQKLTKIRPMTVAQASRISGVSNADITVLLIYLSKMTKNKS